MDILIWGTGKLANRYLDNHYFAGHKIVGFIDTYAKEEQYKGYTVIRPQNIKNTKYDYIIVCVKEYNEDILKKCIDLRLNIREILFINYYAGFGKISSKYVDLLPTEELAKDIFPELYIQMDGFKTQIEYMHVNKEINTFHDESLIEKIGNSLVVAWIPVELLFFERTEDVAIDVYTEAWKELHRELADYPIICSKPHKSLYEFFINGKVFPVAYCEWWSETFSTRGLNSGMTNEDIIGQRFREFVLMQNNLNQGMDFFIKHPSMGKWNKKGYFNLWDGHHRALFLYYSGMRRIPVCVTEEDYVAWMNVEKAKSVYEIIKKQNRFEFYQPILNPYFTNIRSYRDDYTKSRLHHLLNFLGNKRLVGRSVIDIGACLGYFGQMFARMGAEVTMIEYDPTHYELLCELNKLMYVDCKTVMQPFETFETEDTFDIAIMLTVFYPYMKDTAVKKKFLDHINKYVNDLLIWESGDMIESEKEEILKHTKFRHFTHLCYTYGTGKFRELGIFSVVE